MWHILLVGVVAYLVASWIYILLLRAEISECRSYIEERIVKCNPSFFSAGSNPREEHETKGRGNPRRMHSSAAASAQPERATLAGKPQLIVDSSGRRQPVCYRCSRCLRVFPLPEDRTPKEAVTELFQRFTEHVEQEHLTR